MLLEYSVEKPLNREPPIDQLISQFYTKPSLAYDRNHGPLPHINGDTHLVRIDGAVNTALELSVASLRNDYPQVEVISALQCAGNRRHTMRTEVKEVNGIDWNDGAVCNAVWRGPLLSDILKRIGVAIEGDAHVCFLCYETDVQEDTHYGSSVPLSRCLDPSLKVILALEMNGAPLTVNHGFPVRAVVPGVAGARWTKWLDRITVQRHESSNFYQQRDYKILPAHVDTPAAARAHWHLVPPIQGMPINSIIAAPPINATLTRAQLPGGELLIAGYALPQADDGPVVRVEVTADRGDTWHDAEILHPTPTELASASERERNKWAWALWQVRLPKNVVKNITRGTKIWSRATDAGGNRQTGHVPWNFRGVAYNAYGETRGLQIESSDGPGGGGLATTGLERNFGRAKI